jgi:hypothetical protein
MQRCYGFQSNVIIIFFLGGGGSDLLEVFDELIKLTQF